MRSNEARPIYRILAGLIAIPVWLMFFLYFVSMFYDGDYSEWTETLSIFIFALAFSVVAVIGKMPKFLRNFF
jgi:hypothetical protein